MSIMSPSDRADVWMQPHHVSVIFLCVNPSRVGTENSLDVAVKPNSATNVLQNGKLALVTFGMRTAFWSAQRCSSIGMDLDTVRPAKLVMIESKKSQERSGQIMRAHTPVLGKGSGSRGRGARIAKINFDGSSMNVQIVGFDSVRRAEMGECPPAVGLPFLPLNT